MKYVIVCGFIESGSSVICDLLREVRGIGDLGAEFKLFTARGGLVDLKRAFFDQWTPWKSGYAIQEFKRMCGALYSGNHFRFNMINPDLFKYEIEKYIKLLTSQKYSFRSSLYAMEKNPIWKREIRNGNYYFEYGKHPEIQDVFLPPFDENTFYKLTLDMLNSLFADYEKNGVNTIILDQGLLPYHAKELKAFFPKGIMFVVNRNPLDNALYMIKRNKGIGAELRKNLDPQLFATWYIKTRSYATGTSCPSVKHYNFEDLILNYDSMVSEIFDIMQIKAEDHIWKGKFFIPMESQKRIGEWKTFDGGGFHSKDEWIDFCRGVERILNEKAYGDITVGIK